MDEPHVVMGYPERNRVRVKGCPGVNSAGPVLGEGAHAEQVVHQVQGGHNGAEVTGDRGL